MNYSEPFEGLWQPTQVNRVVLDGEHERFAER
jgi:hypothetical protein